MSTNLSGGGTPLHTGPAAPAGQAIDLRIFQFDPAPFRGFHVFRGFCVIGPKPQNRKNRKEQEDKAMPEPRKSMERHGTKKDRFFKYFTRSIARLGAHCRPSCLGTLRRIRRIRTSDGYYKSWQKIFGIEIEPKVIVNLVNTLEYGLRI